MEAHCEPPPIVGAVNVESDHSWNYDVAIITSAGDVNFTTAWFGARIGGPTAIPGRSSSGGHHIDSDGTFDTHTMAPSDFVATGTRPDGTYVGVLHRKLDLFASHPMTVDVSGAQPFRTAALTIPSNATAVHQHLFSAGHTVVNFPGTSSVRYGLPEGQDMPGDLHSIQFEHGTGTYSFTTSTFADLNLQPSPLSEITGLSVTSTVNQPGGSHTIDVTWDSYPGAVGYLVHLSIPICCGPPKYRYESTYFSEAALGGPGCRRAFTRTYFPYRNEASQGVVRAVTSSRGPDYFPLGYPSEEMLTGVTNGVR